MSNRLGSACYWLRGSSAAVRKAPTAADKPPSARNQEIVVTKGNLAGRQIRASGFGSGRAADVAERLAKGDDVARPHGNGHRTTCPLCGTRSLVVTDWNEQLLFCCVDGCNQDEVLAAVEASRVARKLAAGRSAWRPIASQSPREARGTDGKITRSCESFQPPLINRPLPARWAGPRCGVPSTSDRSAPSVPLLPLSLTSGESKLDGVAPQRQPTEIQSHAYSSVQAKPADKGLLGARATGNLTALSPAVAAIRRSKPLEAPEATGHDASLGHDATVSPSNAEPEAGASGPFVILPHDVAMDPRLWADALAVLACRGTFTGAYRLHHVAVRNQFGIGKQRFYAILKLLTECGYLIREQVRQAGGFVRAREEVKFAAAPHRREGYRVHHRTFFDLPISAKSIGLYLYLAAFARTFAMSLSQIQARFRWSNDTARSHLSILVSMGLVNRYQARGAGGRFKGVAYAARRPSAPNGIARETVKPDTAILDTPDPDTAEPDEAARDTEGPDIYLKSNTTDNEGRQTTKANIILKNTTDQRGCIPLTKPVG